MKRIISILLVCCFIFLALVACGKKEPEETGESDSGSGTQASESKTDDSGDDEEVELTLSDTDEFGQNLLNSKINPDDYDYEGKEITVLVRDNSIYYREWEKKDGDAPDSELILDEKIAARNALVESGLGIKLVTVREKCGANGDETRFNQIAASDVTDGVHQYDIVSNYAYFASDTEIRDKLANLNDKSLFPHFNFKLPCWNQAIVKNGIINDKLFVVAGDLNLSMFDSTAVIWANKDLYSQKRNAKTDAEDIQQYAIDGKWVYADLYRWALRTEDTDKSTDCGDYHGFAATFFFFDTIPHAWDLEFVVTGNDGRHSFTLEGNTKAEAALTDVRTLINARGFAPYYGDRLICTCGDNMVNHFTDGDYVFIEAPLYGSEEDNLAIRSMKQKYTILPVPKYEKTQENYGTTANDGYNLVSVLDHSANIDEPMDGEFVSLYLQYANEKSYTDVREFYFERVVRSKYFGVNDEDGTVSKSIELFNTIIDNVEFSLDTIYSRSMNDIVWLWRDNIAKSEGTTLEAAFIQNAFSGAGSERTKAQYEAALAAFDAWIFDET